MIRIVCEFVQKIPQIEEKKNQKELQELAQRILEMIGLIAGSSLEQTTWLRRNLAVKQTLQIAGSEVDDESGNLEVFCNDFVQLLVVHY